ncbi:hypothetical protein F5B22DRAFT_441090 [Xylaria bambusicola]|uniref:uncharacterized protein n=1 Tax=Xylaria bambusicola TaxID=326684 RepID=UPI0020082F57|nr:uncharacterized protein F5B22DRAFT_441090 [Xylaria bambusicola]KAI0506568.1 hypothetical protein F5B22DRAFT_441090 [Xylaria bambusicola]
MPRKYRNAACNTCRQRKLKCDETFPVCQRCSKAQRYCDRSGRPSGHLSSSDLDTNKSSSPDDSPRKLLQSSELASYFRGYINNVAPWYDLSDSSCSFSNEVPLIALDECLLFYAVIALSAMYVSQTTAPSARTIAEMYHTKCIRRLIDLGPEDVLIGKGVALAATCLLRSYEILFEKHDPNRHLKGAFSLASQLRDFVGHPFGDLLHSGFWNYLREDITFSLFGNCPLKMGLDHTLRLHNVSSDQDRLNTVTLVLGRIINAMIGSSAEEASNRWELMLSYIKDWLSDLPPHFQPFSRASIPSLSRLPTVHMLKACHAASRHYCLVSIAVLAIHAQTASRVDDLASLASRTGLITTTVTEKEDLLEQIGLEVCGIAFTSNEPSVLVNAFGPISYCAKHIREEAPQQELIRHLVASKKSTGWPVQQIIPKLQQCWKTSFLT